LYPATHTNKTNIAISFHKVINVIRGFPMPTTNWIKVIPIKCTINQKRSADTVKEMSLDSHHTVYTLEKADEYMV